MGKKKPVGPDGKNWFFQRLLDTWINKYATKRVAIVELKYGRIFAKTAGFDVRPPPLLVFRVTCDACSPFVSFVVQLEEEEAVVLAGQLRALSSKYVKLAGVKYRVFLHDPLSRIVGQVR